MPVLSDAIIGDFEPFTARHWLLGRTFCWRLLVWLHQDDPIYLSAKTAESSHPPESQKAGGNAVKLTRWRKSAQESLSLLSWAWHRPVAMSAGRKTSCEGHNLHPFSALPPLRLGILSQLLLEEEGHTIPIPYNRGQLNLGAQLDGPRLHRNGATVVSALPTSQAVKR